MHGRFGGRAISQRSEIKALHILIYGRVQGVGFRYSTQTQANIIGVTGWIRNVSSDKVEVLMEGNSKQLEKLLQFLKKGPPLASVEKINIHNHALDHYQQFSIKYSSDVPLEP